MASKLDVQQQRFLVLGAHGWIGSQLLAMLRVAAGRQLLSADKQLLSADAVNLQEQKYDVFAAPRSVRLENRQDLAALLDAVQPTHVINAAGLTGVPNIDYCETAKQETIRTNVIGTLNAADLCFQKKIHMTLMATGCIFTYDAEHPVGSGHGFTEEDVPNFHGSFYSKSKALTEPLLAAYPNVLILRLRMPISDDLHEQSFLTKITKYAKICSMPNSVSVLHDLLPLVISMAQRSIVGIMNFTNPGTISHNECLTLYRDIIDPTFKWENFTVEEQAKVLKCGRSNNELNVDKLIAANPEADIPNAKTAVRQALERMAAQKKRD